MSEYQVLYGDDTYDLSRRVNEALADGWVCQGGVSHVETDGTYRRYSQFYQAMTRTVENVIGEDL